MFRKRNHRRGFTLIELTITVAIVGVLSATAIGLFRVQQLRAKRTEAMTNLEAIAKLERGYFGENGTHPSSIPFPPAAPGVKQNWDTADPTAAEFNIIGFSAEGTVWYVYDVNSGASAACACPSSACFTATAYGDSDRDGGIAMISYFHPDGTGTVCPVQLFPAVGPPIDPSDGLPILEAPVDIFQWGGPIADDY